MCIRSALQSRCWEDSHAESSNKIMTTCITNWRKHDNRNMSAQQDDAKGIAVPQLNTFFFRSLSYRQYVSELRGSQNVFERLRVQIYARGSVAVGLRGLESHWGRMYVHCYKQPKQSWSVRALILGQKQFTINKFISLWMWHISTLVSLDFLLQWDCKGCL